MKRDRKIQEELRELAPLLASLKKTNHFSVPEGYFEQNEKKLVEAALIEEKVREWKKSAGNINKVNVPAEYFENFPDKMLARAKGGKIISFDSKVSRIEKAFGWKQWLQVAAAVAALIIMAVPVIKQQTSAPENVEVALHKVSDTDLNTYVSENSVAFNEEEIASHISEAKLEQAANRITAEPIMSDDESLIDVSQIDLNDIQNL